MKRIIIVFFALLFVCSDITAQVTIKPVKKVATLHMPGQTGANGASVVWHPILKKYYASFAGNTTFPFAVFNATGQLLSPDSLEAMFDVRGLWYNTVSQKIEVNGYEEFGWASYTLNEEGIPVDIVQLQKGQVQPDKHSVGVFDAAKKRICFLNGGRILSYSLQGEALDEVIELKKTADEPIPFESYNAAALCYTGKINAEFAVLNHGTMQIELYNRKGILTNAFTLPEDVLVYTNFNFAYANSIWWLFNKDERKWVGFK